MEEQKKKLSPAQKDMILAALCKMVSDGSHYGRTPQDAAKDLIEAARIVNAA